MALELVIQLCLVGFFGFLFVGLSVYRLYQHRQRRVNHPPPLNPPLNPQNRRRLLRNDFLDILLISVALCLQYKLPYAYKADVDLYSILGFNIEFGIFLASFLLSILCLRVFNLPYDYGVLDFFCAMWVQFSVCNYKHKHYFYSFCGVFLSSACVLLKNRFNQLFLGENEVEDEGQGDVENEGGQA